MVRFISRLSIFFLLVLFSLSKSFAISSSDSLKSVTFGIEVSYHLPNVPERFTSNFEIKPSSNMWGFLGFAEFQLMKKMNISTGLGLNRFSYSNLINNDLNANLPQPDSIRHTNLYRVSSKELMISSTITFRFDYVLNPKIYFILGFQPQYRLASNESNVYDGTRISSRTASEIIFLSNPDSAQTYVRKNFTSIGELGVGAEIRNIALEFSFRKIFIKKIPLNFYGFRLRYKI